MEAAPVRPEPPAKKSKKSAAGLSSKEGARHSKAFPEDQSSDKSMSDDDLLFDLTFKKDFKKFRSSKA